MPKRRERGSGSISKRQDGSFVACIELEKSSDGKRRRRYVYGKTKSDVRAELDRLQVDKQRGIVLQSQPDRMTVGTYLQNWIDGKEASLRTLDQYRSLIDKWLVPQLGTTLLTALNENRIDEFLRWFRDKHPSKSRTRQVCYDVLRAALNRAVALKKLPSNPMAGSERPYVPRRDLTPWMFEEAERVLKAARSDRFHALYVLELRLGLQFPGEVLGLRWDLDVDMQTRTIRVGGQLARGRRGATKTPARRRSLDMPEDVFLALSAHRERLLAEGLRSSEYVFPNGQGGPQEARNFVRDSFEKVVAAAGVRRLRPYDMRHSFATIALTAGVHIKVVSHILGHANEMETLRTYSHFIPSQMADANALVDAFWERSRAAQEAKKGGSSETVLRSIGGKLGGKSGLRAVSAEGEN